MKTRSLVAVVALIACSALRLSSQEATQATGRSIILVQDTSPSIIPYFPNLKDVLASTLIEGRLGLGDYFSLITFTGDVRNADGAKIEFTRDKEARSSIWRNIRPEGAFTDIGNALKSALLTSIDLKNKGYSKYEPLVLFITDGEHEPPPSSPFSGRSIDQLFQDPIIGDTTLYSGWYFVGLGKDLKDIRRIAELAGRRNAFLSIDDPTALSSILDAWIRQIPAPVKLESATVRPANLNWGQSKLDQLKPTDLQTSKEGIINWDLVSDFQTSASSVVITDVDASFQSTDNRIVVRFEPAWERGRIIIPPKGTSKQILSLVAPTAPQGKGTLKIDIHAEVNHRGEDMLLSFPVAFLSSWAFFWRTWLLPVIIFTVIVLATITWLVIRKYLPKKITMEVIGQRKNKTTSVKIGERVDFGGRASLKLRLEGNWPAVIGSIRRTGPTSWEIQVKDGGSFQGGYIGGPYQLGSSIKLLNSEGLALALKFITGD